MNWLPVCRASLQIPMKKKQNWANKLFVFFRSLLLRNDHLVALTSVKLKQTFVGLSQLISKYSLFLRHKPAVLKNSLFNIRNILFTRSLHRMHQKWPYFILSLKFLSKHLIHKSLHWVTVPHLVYICKPSSKNARAKIWNLQLQNSTCCWTVGFICTGPGFVNLLFREPISSGQIRSYGKRIGCHKEDEPFLAC